MKPVEYMERALTLAERGRGRVEPNPMVGAVVVREGVIVGEGWHEAFGHAHAEVNALADAGEQARGADLFVTLEPCCHHGKTPPCVDAILRAGIRNVHAAMLDPFPQVAGGGFARLREANLGVTHGLLETQARILNAPYLKLVSRSHPYVRAKWAMTLDGKIATATGDSKWISGPESRRLVHELRGSMDGILIGVQTALADDPLLTARPPGPRLATRVVLDSSLRLPLTSRLVQTARETPLLLIHEDTVSPAQRQPYVTAGCECLAVPQVEGRLSVPTILDALGRRRWTNLLVEGGGEVLGSFLEAGEIDEVYAFVAPKLLGGRNALTPMAGKGIASLSEAIGFTSLRARMSGEDVLLHGRKRVE